MRINHNMTSINANNVLKFKNVDTAKSMEKLSSGLRINRAGDDASGLAVSEKMRGQIRGLLQAEKNVENGISFIQAAEGYLQETQDIVHRVRELSIQAANGIYTPEDRGMMQVEVNQLIDEVNRIASHAEFNSLKLIDGTFAENTGSMEMYFHVGANVDQREQLFIGDMSASALGIEKSANSAIAISTPDKANAAIADLDKALNTISEQRADLGAYQNRFEMAQKGIAIAAENIQAAESTIRDTDMASQMVEYVKDNILVQSGTAMLAQANTRPQSVLQLLG